MEINFLVHRVGMKVVWASQHPQLLSHDDILKLLLDLNSPPTQTELFIKSNIEEKVSLRPENFAAGSVEKEMCS